MLIRVESEWHLIALQSDEIWQHWSIEKNLISIDGETLDFTYEAPPPYSDSNLLWPLLTGGFVIAGVVVVLLISGKIPKKK